MRRFSPSLLLFLCLGVLAADIFLCRYLIQLYFARLFVSCWTCYFLFGGSEERSLRLWLDPQIQQFYFLLVTLMWSVFLAVVGSGHACYVMHASDLTRRSPNRNDRNT